MTEYSFQGKYHAQRVRYNDRISWPEDGVTVLRIYTFPHKVTDADFKLGRYIKQEVSVGDVVNECYSKIRTHFLFKQSKNCGLLQNIHGDWLGNCRDCDEARSVRRAKDRSGRRFTAKTHYYVNAAEITPGTEEPYTVRIWRLPESAMNVVIGTLDAGEDRIKQIFGDTGWDLTINYDSSRRAVEQYLTVMGPSETDLTDRTVGKPFDVLADGRLYAPWIKDVIDGVGEVPQKWGR